MAGMAGAGNGMNGGLWGSYGYGAPGLGQDKMQQNQWDSLQAQKQLDAQKAMQAAGQQGAMQRDAFGAAAAQAEADRNRAFQGSQADATRGFQGAQAGLDRANQMSIAQMPWDYKNKVFNTVSPLLSGLMGGGGASGSAGGAMDVQGGRGMISTGGMFSPGQIDQQVNAARASNERQGATQNAKNAAQTAGQGFGAGSPLLAALQNQTQMGTMGANADADRNIRYAGAEGNAKMLLGQQTAAAGAANDQAGVEASLVNGRQNYQASLLAALAGML